MHICTRRSSDTALERHGLLAVKLNTPGSGFPIWLVDGRYKGSSSAETLLGPDERARADRFRSAELRCRYVNAHSTLRLLGESYFGLPAHEQVYMSNEFGKPRLVGSTKWKCSISYSGNHAAVAWHEGHEIGVDIEGVRPIDDAADLAQLHYTLAERAALMASKHDSATFTREFLTVWVRKEACIKAVGRGFDMPLSTFECGTRHGTMPVEVAGQQLQTGVVRTAHDHLVAWAVCRQSFVSGPSQ